MPTVLAVSGMTCDGCEEIVQQALEEVDGVEAAEVDREDGIAEVVGTAKEAELIQAIDFAGYDASPESPAS